MIIYTDYFIPARFGGINYGPISFIRTKYKDDAGLAAHENTHQKQFWKNPLMGLFYVFSKKSRFKYEAEAYKVQLTYSSDKLNLFASFLVEKYNLGITLAEATAALQ